MNFSRCNVHWIVAVAVLLLNGAAAAGAEAVTPAMAGNWQGSGKIVVIWCHQPSVAVSVTIQLDGQVTGQVGDARLVDGRFARNRGWLGRKLNLATDYIIAGRLEGPLVAAEGITRSRVMIPLNFDGGKFAGGLGTSGWPFGGKKGMPFTVRNLTLHRSP